MKMDQPKIGLALGCGAARGLAHIGVLKVLEKYHRPVDIAIVNNLKSKIDDLIKFSKISEVSKKEEKEKYFSPNFINITLNTINIFEREIIKLRLEKDKPDFLIEPDTSNAILKVFYKGKEAIQAGEEAASKIIPAIKKYIERKQKWIQKELS